MLIRVDPTSSTPLGDQIATCVRNALISANLSPGERLPPAREPASSLGVDMHTVPRWLTGLVPLAALISGLRHRRHPAQPRR
jgi:DNA-binding transcriptional regulator YhcF (GntR family)